MPGSLASLDCPHCGSHSEIETGAGICPDGTSGFHMDQFVCPRCKVVQTVATGCDDHTEERECETCGEPLVPWDGSVRVTLDPWKEVIEGPCPNCGQTLEASERGLWD